MSTDTRPKESRTERRRREAAEALDRAAIGLLYVLPEHDVTVEMIADEADIGHSSFYSHHESKEAFFVDLRARMSTVVASVIPMLLGSNESSASSMATAIAVMYEDAKQHQDWLVYALDLRHDGFELGGPVDEALLDLIRRGLASNEFSDVRDVGLATLMVRTCVRSALRLAGQVPDERDSWSATARQCLSLLGADDVTIENALRAARSGPRQTVRQLGAELTDPRGV